MRQIIFHEISFINISGGMTQNCPIWNTVESKDWKDKTAIAKINRSNMIYTARAVYPSFNTSPSVETSEEGERLDRGSNSPVTFSRGPITLSVRSKSMDKLIHILAVLHQRKKSMISNLHQTCPICLIVRNINILPRLSLRLLQNLDT